MALRPRWELRSESAATRAGTNRHAAISPAQQQWTLEMQARLTAIAAPTGNESARARSVQRGWRASGIDECTVDRAGKVRAVVGNGRDDPLVCLALLDAVCDASVDGPSRIAVHRDGTLLRAASWPVPPAS